MADEGRARRAQMTKQSVESQRQTATQASGAGEGADVSKMEKAAEEARVGEEIARCGGQRRGGLRLGGGGRK